MNQQHRQRRRRRQRIIKTKPNHAHTHSRCVFRRSVCVRERAPSIWYALVEEPFEFSPREKFNSKIYGLFRVVVLFFSIARCPWFDAAVKQLTCHPTNRRFSILSKMYSFSTVLLLILLFFSGLRSEQQFQRCSHIHVRIKNEKSDNTKRAETAVKIAKSERKKSPHCV